MTECTDGLSILTLYWQRGDLKYRVVETTRHPNGTFTHVIARSDGEVKELTHSQVIAILNKSKRIEKWQ